LGEAQTAFQELPREDSAHDQAEKQNMSMNADKENDKQNPEFGRHWNDKLKLLDAIDSLRGEARRNTAGEAKTGGKSLDSHPDGQVETLREKLRLYENTCALLEREVQELEQQTLAALAEASRLRRELNAREAEIRLHGGDADNRVRQALAEAENERLLLLEALENSETELSRMVKTLDQVARKFQVA
jgi:hypothetical protein